MSGCGVMIDQGVSCFLEIVRVVCLPAFSPPPTDSTACREAIPTPHNGNYQ